MNRKRWYFFIPFVVVAAVLILGLVIRWLWNAILPPLTGVGIISFWQSVGLLILSRILFGGFNGGGRRWKGDRKWQGRSPQMRERWMQMSDEERAKLKEAWRERCRKKEDQ